MAVYSERFILHSGPTEFAYYTVPNGKRAVIRCVTCTSGSSLQQYSEVVAAGAYLFFLSFPAPGSLVEGNLRTVVYAGEVIQVRHAGTILWTTVSGYLFDDDADTSMMAAAEASRSAEDVWSIEHYPAAGL